MRVHIATDHAGMELSQFLIKHLAADGYQMIDHGPLVYDPVDDYPAFCIHAAQAVMADRAEGLDSLGIVLGGSGNGEQIAANKVPGVRAALAWSIETAQLAREHNDAQIVALGGRQHSPEEGLEIVRTFLSTPFSSQQRHARRIDQIAQFERTEDIPGMLVGVQARPFGVEESGAEGA